MRVKVEKVSPTDAHLIRPADIYESQGMNDGEPEHDLEPEPVTVTGMQATAAVSHLHPPEMLAKLCICFKTVHRDLLIFYKTWSF